MKTVIVGIGNPILGDDGVGIHIIRDVQKRSRLKMKVDFDEAQTGWMNLLDMIIGYDHAILVDAVSVKNRAHGEVWRFGVEDLPSVHSQNPHDVSFPEALYLARSLGEERLPQSITIIGVNLGQIPRVFSDSLSPEIQSSIPCASDMVLFELQQIKKKHDEMKKNT